MGVCTSKNSSKGVASKTKYAACSLKDEKEYRPIVAWSEEDLVRNIALACAEGDVETLRAIVDERGAQVLDLRDPGTVNAGPLLRVPLAQSYVIRMTKTTRRDPGHQIDERPHVRQHERSGSVCSSTSSIADSQHGPDDMVGGLPPAHLAAGVQVLRGAFMSRVEKEALRAQRRENNSAVPSGTLPSDVSAVDRKLSPPGSADGDAQTPTASVNKSSISPSLVRIDDIPTTPLIAACRHGRKDVVNFLVEHGVCIDEIWAETTALIEAVRHEYEIISRLLLFRGASIVTNEESDAQESGPYSNLERSVPPSSALHVCVESGHKGLLELMLGESTFVDIVRVSDGYTPLHCAAETNNVFAARGLVECGAALDIANNAGLTPVGLATERGHAEVAALLKLADLGGPQVKAKRRRRRGQLWCCCLAE